MSLWFLKEHLGLLQYIETATGVLDISTDLISFQATQ